MMVGTYVSFSRLAQILVFIGTFGTTTIVQAQHDANGQAQVERDEFAKATRLKTLTLASPNLNYRVRPATALMERATGHSATNLR